MLVGLVQVEQVSLSEGFDPAFPPRAIDIVAVGARVGGATHR